MSHRLIGFVDGENLTLRYQDMLATGLNPTEGVTHIKNTLVWHPEISCKCLCDVIRIYYYQTVVGDTDKLNQTKKAIRKVSFDYFPTESEKSEYSWSGYLFPKLFKKDKTSAKTKSVDINLTIDMLRHASDDKFDILFLMSGDGDYVPLVEEITRMGKQVWVGAFSKGLNENLKFSADEFFNFDDYFFLPPEAAKEKSKKQVKSSK